MLLVGGDIQNSGSRHRHSRVVGGTERGAALIVVKDKAVGDSLPAAPLGVGTVPVVAGADPIEPALNVAGPQMPFAGVKALVPLLAQIVGDRRPGDLHVGIFILFPHPQGPQVGQMGHPGLVGLEPGEEGSAGRRADGAGGAQILHKDAFAGHPVPGGGPTGGPAQDSERVQALIVADQKDDVGSGGGAHGFEWLWEQARLRRGHGTGNRKKGGHYRSPVEVITRQERRQRCFAGSSVTSKVSFNSCSILGLRAGTGDSKHRRPPFKNFRPTHVVGSSVYANWGQL